MDINKLACPDIFIINSEELKGKRNTDDNSLKIPYTQTPDIGIGDIISQKAGMREISLKIIDVSFLEGGTLNVGTRHPHMLTLKTENTTAQEHSTKNDNSTINIGSVAGDQVQIGNNNNQITNLHFQQLIEQVSKSNDSEAKSLLKSLLKNSTVASVVGASVTALLGLL